MPGKTLFISDFDDTLVTTSATIGVKKADGTSVNLSPAEYAVYDTQAGDEFDYSQFDDLHDPKPIQRYVRLLKKAIATDKVHKVVILTARGHERPVVKFLKSVGITGGLKIVALGDSDPQKKKDYIERQIKKGYDRIAFVDDSPKNVEASRELHKKHPHVALLVHHVKPHTNTSSDQIPQDTHGPTRSAVSISKHQPNKTRPLGDIDSITVVNPQTKRTIKLTSALTYDASHPVYAIAQQKIKSLRQQ